MNISLAVLFGLILALAVISMNLLQYLNVFVARIVLAFEAKSTKQLVLKNLIAHKDRNRMASLVFSLSLGFIMYLNIASRIPYAKDLNEHHKNGGTRCIQLGRMNLPIQEIEDFLRLHEYAFEEWGVITN